MCFAMLYCLMTNHFRLLLETPDANLSKVTRHRQGASRFVPIPRSNGLRDWTLLSDRERDSSARRIAIQDLNLALRVRNFIAHFIDTPSHVCKTSVTFP